MIKMPIKEKRVARILQHNIPLTALPFAELRISCGLSAAEIIKTVHKLLQKGIIRRFGAIVNHRNIGYKKNALVIWSVKPGDVEAAGKILASFPFVSHCYERKPAFQNNYNLFAMLHSPDENIAFMVETAAQAIANRNFIILESLQEYKKESPEYFHDEK